MIAGWLLVEGSVGDDGQVWGEWESDAAYVRVFVLKNNTLETASAVIDARCLRGGGMMLAGCLASVGEESGCL